MVILRNLYSFLKNPSRIFLIFSASTLFKSFVTLTFFRGAEAATSVFFLLRIQTPQEAFSKHLHRHLNPVLTLRFVVKAEGSVEA